MFDALSVALHSQVTLETLKIRKIITLFMTVYSKLVVDRRWCEGLMFIFHPAFHRDCKTPDPSVWTELDPCTPRANKS
jgi:hypothetical protein